MDWLIPVAGLCEPSFIETVYVDGEFCIVKQISEQIIAELTVAPEQLSQKDTMSVKFPVFEKMLQNAPSGGDEVAKSLASTVSGMDMLQNLTFRIADLSQSSVLPLLAASGSLEVNFAAEFCSSVVMQNRFSACVPGLSAVKQLDLAFVNSVAPGAPTIDYACISCIGSAMCKLTNVRMLSLSTVSCPARKFHEVLAPGIANHQCFEQLSIWATTRPYRHLHCAPLVSVAPSLKELGLAGCKSDDADVELLVEALLKFRTANLERLDFNGSRDISDESAASLCRVFDVLWNLQQLTIKRTGFSRRGMTALCAALVGHPRFREMYALFNLRDGLSSSVQEVDTIRGSRESGRAFFCSVTDLFTEDELFNCMMCESEFDRGGDYYSSEEEEEEEFSSDGAMDSDGEMDAEDEDSEQD